MTRKSKPTPDERAASLARRESRKTGVEFRPTSAQASDEAERLERGFRMLNQDDDDEFDPDEED